MWDKLHLPLTLADLLALDPADPRVVAVARDAPKSMSASRSPKFSMSSSFTGSNHNDINQYFHSPPGPSTGNDKFPGKNLNLVNLPRFEFFNTAFNFDPDYQTEEIVDAEPLSWNAYSKSLAGHNSPSAPLCEDLNDEVLDEGDRCYSTCQGQCPSHVLKPGLVFDFDEIKPGHPGCTSHFECIGNFDRVLCHATEMGANAAGVGWFF